MTSSKTKNRLQAHDEANKAHPQYRADAAKSAIDEELLEELRSQGYVRPE